MDALDTRMLTLIRAFDRVDEPRKRRFDRDEHIDRMSEFRESSSCI
jgi:hypothetical protein